MRRLVISTDGYSLSVEACELSGLEVKALLGVLLDSINRGEFPYPGDPPILEVSKPKEEK